MKHRILLSVLLSFVLFVGGCGYTTSSNLSSRFRTVYVEDFKNKITYSSASGKDIYIPLLEVKSRNAVIDRFLFDGNLRIAEAQAADLVLKGELKSYQRDGLRVTDNDDVLEYRVRIIVRFTLWDTRMQEVVWEESSFAGEATYFVTGAEATSEDAAIEEAIVDLARRVVERTIENW
ncbi:LPS assembly lipoprotein LptE [Candidatus Omnitrophota bacterium]